MNKQEKCSDCRYIEISEPDVLYDIDKCTHPEIVKHFDYVDTWIGHRNKDGNCLFYSPTLWKKIKNLIKVKAMNYQEPPKYYGYNSEFCYNNGYAKTTKCKKCGTTGLYEDCHPTNPCKRCGGKVEEGDSAKWVPPEYTGHLWWKRIVKEGYWKKCLKEYTENNENTL
jgi:hypothetical protein